MFSNTNRGRIPFYAETRREENEIKVKAGCRSLFGLRKLWYTVLPFLFLLISPEAVDARANSFDPETVLAEYKGGRVKIAEYDEEFYKIPQIFRARYASRAGRKRLLEEIVINRIAYIKAVEMELDIKPDTFIDYEKELSPYFAALYRRTEITDRVSVSENDLKNYYLNNQQRFRFRGRNVIKYLNVEDNNLRAVAGAIRRSTDFREIMNRYSTDSFSKRNRGIIGNIRGNGFIPGIGNDEILDKKIAEADIDVWVGPVSTKTGNHFFKVIERVEEGSIPYNEVKNEIEYLLRHRQETELKKERVQELKAKYNVEIDEERLSSLNLLAFTPDSIELDDIIIKSDIREMNVTIGDLYDHFRNLSPYLISEDLTGKNEYYSQFRQLSQEEIVEVTKPATLERLVNNIVEVSLFDYEARTEKEFDTDQPEIIMLLREEEIGKYDKQVFEHPEVQQLRRHIILKAFFRQTVKDIADPTPADIEYYYNDNKEIFTTIANRAIRLFLYETNEEAQKARNKALDIIEIENPEIYHEKMGQLISQSIYTPRMGTIPYIYKNSLHHVIGNDSIMYDAIWNTGLGQLSEVSRNQRGLSFFIEVIECNPAYTYPLDHLDNYITDLLTFNNRSQRWEEVKNELLEEYDVKMYPERLFIILSAEELFSLAEESTIRRHFREALQYYDQIIEHHNNGEDDYKALFMKGYILAHKINEAEKAIQVLRKVINDFPHSSLHESAEYLLNTLSER